MRYGPVLNKSWSKPARLALLLRDCPGLRMDQRICVKSLSCSHTPEAVLLSELSKQRLGVCHTFQLSLYVNKLGCASSFDIWIVSAQPGSLTRRK
ncbi:hypothetical protein VTO42DRAFT_7159 [Malbranchea cinnamomea]